MRNFAEKVYKFVKQIPKGKVVSYGEIAAKLGNPKAARAVGNALHYNPDLKTIPCHRVVSKKGKLAANYGFGGWKEQRQKLLAEGVQFKDERHVEL